MIKCVQCNYHIQTVYHLCIMSHFYNNFIMFRQCNYHIYTIYYVYIIAHFYNKIKFIQYNYQLHIIAHNLYTFMQYVYHVCSL